MISTGTIVTLEHTQNKEESTMVNKEGKKQIIKVYSLNKKGESYFIESEDEWIGFRNGIELMMTVNGDDPEKLAVSNDMLINDYTGECYAGIEYYVQH